MNSCMIFQAHVAALASAVSVAKEKLVLFAAVLFLLPFNRPNKCNEHQMLHRNVMNDCVEEIPNFIFLCRNFMVTESPLAVIVKWQTERLWSALEMVILRHDATQSFLFLMLHQEKAAPRGKLQELRYQLLFGFRGSAAWAVQKLH